MKEIEGIDRVIELLTPHWAEIEADFNRNNERFLQLIEADHDAIGRVLRAHLAVESFLNSHLSSTLGVQDLERLRLSFFQKASLLPEDGTSASFVRPGILQLNAIRNKFGHEIGHRIMPHEISAIHQVLEVARAGALFNDPVTAIEAFAPVACAFLSVSPAGLQATFAEAFQHVHGHDPEQA